MYTIREKKYEIYTNECIPSFPSHRDDRRRIVKKNRIRRILEACPGSHLGGTTTLETLSRNGSSACIFLDFVFILIKPFKIFLQVFTVFFSIYFLVFQPEC